MFELVSIANVSKQKSGKMERADVKSTSPVIWHALGKGPANLEAHNSIIVKTKNNMTCRVHLIFAGPLPRACQITSTVSSFKNLLPLLQQLHGFRVGTFVPIIRTPFSTSFEELLVAPSPTGPNFWIFSNHFTFFRNKSRTMPKNCSNSCFLFEKCVREGGLSGSHPAFRLSLPELVWDLGGFFFLDWFPGASFLIKNAFWEPTWLQNGVKIDSESDLRCNFYIFQGTLILNDPPLILVYF